MIKRSNEELSRLSIRIKIIYLYYFMLCIPLQATTLPNYGTPVWDNVVTDLAVDITTLSKLCIINSSLPSLSIISDIDSIAASLSNIESYLQIINSKDGKIQSTLNNLDQFVQTTINSKVDLIENTDSSILSVVQVIDTRTSSIYSLDQTIASKVHANFATDQTILSKVMALNTDITNLSSNCSGLSQIAQNDRSILSKVQVIDTRTSSIYSTDNTILSYISNINLQEISIGSSISNLNQLVLTLNSNLDVIENTDLSILSRVNVINTRTGSIYSLDQIISSQVDLNTSIEKTIQSVVQVIDSKVDNLALNCSSLSQIINNDQTTLSKLSVIDTRTSTIVTTVNNIYSLDQIISSNVNNIYSLDQVISSKADVNISLDKTILSTVSFINSAVNNISNPCSAITSILNNDLTVQSLVNVIDTRTSNIQSNVSNISSLSSVISSKMDTNIDIDLSTQSSVNIINSRTSIINSDITNISILNNSIYSTLAVLSACCTFTTQNQPFTTIYGTQLIENRIDNISLQFQYGIPPTVTAYTQGGGTVTTANSVATLSTAASAGSIAQLQTKNTIVYRPGHEAYAYFTVAFTGSFTATSSQFIGPIDYSDGFAVGFNGSTFGITYRSNTINTFIPQSQFNGDKLDGTGPSGFVYTPAFLNVFRIGYGAAGASIITFQIMNSFGTWITFHTLNFVNNLSIPAITQPFLPITARVENITGTSVLSMKTVSWNGGIIGSPNNSSFRYFQNTTTNTTINGTNIFILTLRNKTTFNNLPNKIQVSIVGFGGGNNGSDNKFSIISLIRNGTLSGTSFTDIDSNNSVMEISTTGSVSGGTLVWTNPSGLDGDASYIQLFPNQTYNIILLPGDTLTIVGTSIASTSVDVNTAWEEQF